MKKIAIKTIHFYQNYISPLLGSNCRFYPTCSTYTAQAIEKKGLFKGIALGSWRILRCNTWNKNSGFDPVEKETENE